MRFLSLFFALFWGLGGILLLLGSAIYRLTPKALAAFETPLTPSSWLFLAFCVLFMGFYEGYKGFQQRFSPRSAARILFLSQKPSWIRLLFAPFFIMGYFHAVKKTQLTAIFLTIGMIILVILVRFCPQPWRGFIDCGVVLGLFWGMLSLLYYTLKGFSQKQYPHDPCVPPALF